MSPSVKTVLVYCTAKKHVAELSCLCRNRGTELCPSRNCGIEIVCFLNRRTELVSCGLQTWSGTKAAFYPIGGGCICPVLSLTELSARLHLGPTLESVELCCHGPSRLSLYGACSVTTVSNRQQEKAV